MLKLHPCVKHIPLNGVFPMAAIDHGKAHGHCHFQIELKWISQMSKLSNKSKANYRWAQAGFSVPRGVLPSVSVLAFWGHSYGTKIHCSHILRDICSLLVSMVLIWLYTQAICASSAHVFSEVSTLHNQIILELSNWKKGLLCTEQSAFHGSFPLLWFDFACLC